MPNFPQYSQKSAKLCGKKKSNKTVYGSQIRQAEV